ncbi:MAG TPA: hypothetical protein VGB64_04960 [Actinomycetota bacterium]
MRKRGFIAAIGLAALLVLAVAPGTASAIHEFGIVTVEQPPSTPLVEGVWVPLGGGFGDVAIERAPSTPLAEGVWVPLGGGLGDVAIVTLIVPGSQEIPATTPSKPAGPANSCYQGACADQTLAGAVPDLNEMFGGGAHSYGPQQALRLGGM